MELLQISLTNSNVISFGRNLEEAVSRLIVHWGYNYVPFTARGAVAIVESVAKEHKLGEVMVTVISQPESSFIVGDQ